VVATTRLRVSVNCWLQVGAFARLLAAVALDMGSAGFAGVAAMLALRNGTTLLVDVLKGTIRVLAVAHAVATDAGLARVLLAVD
jgi:hypothetical protein